MSLQAFVESFSESEDRSWRDSIPKLQREAGELVERDAKAREYTAILEYQLPLEARRADGVVLLDGAVVVLELKGKQTPSRADIDQAAAYGRDLLAYHRDCHDRPVHVVLVPTRADDQPREEHGIHVVGPGGLAPLLEQFAAEAEGTGPSAVSFLSEEAYRPLPTLVQAARELFHSRQVREVWKAKAATDPAVETIARVAHEAARTKTRRLVLVTGVPGSGKTLVGMRTVHAGFLDDLAVERDGGKPSVPALMLSGNAPLVEVLQYEFKSAGGGGKTFVRGVMNYLDAYAPKPERIPPEHLLVFDEAQRAFSLEMVQAKHKKWPEGMARSEPGHFIEICERMPEWCVMVGLVGGGQEIHAGEEEGLKQWRHALDECHDPTAWTVHAPADVEELFDGCKAQTAWEPSLSLDTELRFHLTADLHRFVGHLIDEPDLDGASWVAETLLRPKDAPIGISLYVTRDLDQAREYLWGRYEGQPDARYGLIASSRDKALEDWGVDNGHMATKVVKKGPWFADKPNRPRSCCQLEICLTEFDIQGLELDMALLAWGTDFMREDGQWTNRKAKGYRQPVEIRDAFTLRQNAYRVLLTRGRDGTIVFVPPLPELEETAEFLLAAGFEAL